LAITIPIPATRVRLAIFEPITSPKESDVVPERPELIATNNSGRLVDSAIKINAATNSLICKIEATRESDLTIKCPLRTSTANDSINSSTYNNNIYSVTPTPMGNF